MIAAHPCGRVMDRLRFGYRTMMRTSTEAAPVEVVWYKARDDAPVYEDSTVFRSRIWKPFEEYAATGIGEQTAVCCKRRDLVWYNSKEPDPIIIGPVPCGSPTVFARGGGPHDPLYLTNANGTAPCCIHPCFTDGIHYCFTLANVGGPRYSVLSGWLWEFTTTNVGQAPCVLDDEQFTVADGDLTYGWYRVRIEIQPGRGGRLSVQYKSSGVELVVYTCPDVTANPAIWTYFMSTTPASDWFSELAMTTGPCPPPRECPTLNQFHVTYPHIFGPRCVTLTRLNIASRYARFTKADGVSGCGWVLSDSGYSFPKTLNIISGGTTDCAVYSFFGGCGPGTANLVSSTGVRPWDNEPWPATLAVGTGPCP